MNDAMEPYDAFSQTLRACRRGEMSPEHLAQLAQKAQSSFASRLGPTRAFKVRQGRPQLAFLRLLVACPRCSAIAPQGEQATYLDFTEVSQAVEAAELAGVLYRTELPCWYEEGPQVLGGSSSFAASNAVPTGVSSSLSTAREAVGSESHDQV